MKETVVIRVDIIKRFNELTSQWILFENESRSKTTQFVSSSHASLRLILLLHGSKDVSPSYWVDSNVVCLSLFCLWISTLSTSSYEPYCSRRVRHQLTSVNQSNERGKISLLCTYLVTRIRHSIRNDFVIDDIRRRSFHLSRKFENCWHRVLDTVVSTTNSIHIFSLTFFQ